MSNDQSALILIVIANIIIEINRNENWDSSLEGMQPLKRRETLEHLGVRAKAQMAHTQSCHHQFRLLSACTSWFFLNYQVWIYTRMTYWKSRVFLNKLSIISNMFVTKKLLITITLSIINKHDLFKLLKLNLKIY